MPDITPWRQLPRAPDASPAPRRIRGKHRDRRQNPDSENEGHMKQRVRKGQRRQLGHPEPADHQGVRHAQQHLAQLPDHQGQGQPQGQAGFMEQIHVRIALMRQTARLSKIFRFPQVGARNHHPIRIFRLPCPPVLVILTPVSDDVVNASPNRPCEMPR
jgi:hypothetical protein